MRTLAIALASLTLTVASTASARGYESDFRYEIKGGLVNSFLTSNDFQDTGFGSGWTAGGGVKLPLFTRWLAVQLEAHYVQKHATATFIGTPFPGISSSNSEYEFDVQYTEIPVLANLTLVADADVRAYLSVGQILSIRTKSKATTIGPNGGLIEFDLEDVKNYNWAPAAGLGVRANRFLFEVRFALGVVDLGEEGSGTDSKISSTYVLAGGSF